MANPFLIGQTVRTKFKGQIVEAQVTGIFGNEVQVRVVNDGLRRWRTIKTVWAIEAQTEAPQEAIPAIENPVGSVTPVDTPAEEELTVDSSQGEAEPAPEALEHADQLEADAQILAGAAVEQPAEWAEDVFPSNIKRSKRSKRKGRK